MQRCSIFIGHETTSICRLYKQSEQYFKSKNYQIRRKKRQGRKLGNKQKQIINQKYIDNIREINRLDIL